MSKSAIAGFAAGCIVCGVLIGLYFLTKTGAERAGREAARTEIRQQVQDSIHKAADESGRQEAREIADQILSAQGKAGAATSPPSAPPSALPVTSPPPSASSTTAPIAIERDAFAVDLPAGASVDPESASVGSERLVTANLPGHGLTSFVTVDDPARAERVGDDARKKLRAKVENAVDVAAAALDSPKVKHATGLQGSLNGLEFVYEVGQVAGRDKACVIVVEYPQDDKDQVASAVRQAMQTFRMKQ